MAVALLAIGLYNANNFDLGDKGFYAMAYVLCMFSAITVQKNVRDQLVLENQNQDGKHHGNQVMHTNGNT